MLYNPDTDETSMVNLTGRELWFFLQTARTAEEIAGHLVQNYRNVSIVQAAEDAQQFIESLVPDFLLEIHDGT